MYRTMYKKFKNQGIIKHAIFKIWYEMEWLRCEVKEKLQINYKKGV